MRVLLPLSLIAIIAAAQAGAEDEAVTTIPAASNVEAVSASSDAVEATESDAVLRTAAATETETETPPADETEPQATATESQQ